MDIEKNVKIKIGDSEVRRHLLEQFGITDSIKVQELQKEGTR